MPESIFILDPFPYLIELGLQRVVGTTHSMHLLVIRDSSRDRQEGLSMPRGGSSCRVAVCMARRMEVPEASISACTTKGYCCSLSALIVAVRL